MNQRDGAPLVSVVIASLNEQEGIRACLNKILCSFAANRIAGEIVIADNSDDNTPAIAREMGGRVVIPAKLGYGHALVYGIDQARGDIIIVGDADNTYDFEVIPYLLRALQDGKADLVIGSRFKGEIKRGAMPWLHRYIGNPLLTVCLNLRLGTRVSDAHSGIRAFTREIWNRLDKTLLPDDFCSEMLKQMVQQHAKIVEIPVVYYPRYGKTKAGTLLHGWRCFKFLLLYIFLKRVRFMKQSLEVSDEVLC